MLQWWLLQVQELQARMQACEAMMAQIPDAIPSHDEQLLQLQQLDAVIDQKRFRMHAYYCNKKS